MLGIGFIPLIMAYEYIKNRSKYPDEYFVIAVSYLISLPNVYYDYFIYSNQQGFFYTLGPGILPFLAYGILFVSGGFLLIKGLQAGYSRFFRKEMQKEEKQ